VNKGALARLSARPFKQQKSHDSHLIFGTKRNKLDGMMPGSFITADEKHEDMDLMM
jgi:hypothetical protein